MSSIDERIVKMVFDNSQFEGKVSSTINSIKNLNKATDDIGKNSGSGLSSLGDAFEKTEITATKAGFHIQDVWLKVASIFEYQIAGKIVDCGKKIANALTIEGVTDGFKEYELKMGSIQTIMAGTGESLATVNRQLEELNKYSDQTIYSFADMTNNIGKFTNAGVKLEDAVAAIKGIANEAAISGANANEASRAMYNFSQALSAGYVKLIDWKSIENANMATKGFKETLLDVASACGTVEKAEDGMYKVLTTNAQGSTMDDAISGTKNFNDSLAYQWMTTEVLTKALKIYATDVRTLTVAEKEAFEAELKAMGMTDEQIQKFEELGIKATDAASEIKTFSMLIDTLKEAVGSGWAMTWQYIIGDFEQAKALWTEVGKVLGGAIDNMSEARNKLIKESLQTGWEKFTTMEGAAIPESEKFRDVLLDVARAHGKLTEEQIEGIDSTEDLVKSFHDLHWATGPMLTEAVDSYLGSLQRMTDEEKKEIGVTDADISQLEALQAQLREGSLDADAFADSMNKMGGREKLIYALRNAFEGVVNIIKPIGAAFREVFPALTSDDLYSKITKLATATTKFRNLFNEMTVAGKKRVDELKRASKGLFSIFDIGAKFIKAFVDAVLPATKHVGSFADLLLEAAAKVGDFFTKLDQNITEGKVFENFFQNIADGIKKLTGGVDLSKVVGTIKELFSSFKGVDTNKFSGIADFFKKVFDDISGGVENLKKRLGALKPLVDGIVSLFKGAAKVIGGVLKQIGDSLSGMSEGGGALGLSGLLNTALSGGIMYKLFSGAKAGSDAVSSISGFLDSLGGAIETFNKRVNSETILNIGKGIALLAGSLFVIAMVDSDKLAGATAAISTMIGVMAGAMAVLMKAVNSFSTTDVQKTFSIFGKSIFSTDATKMLEMSVILNSVSKALISMGAAVLMMAVGLKIVSTAAEDGHLWDSFAVISLMLAELTGVVILLGKFGRKGIKGADSLKDMTMALVIMSAALAIVAKVAEGGNAWQALAIISIMLAELGGIVILVEKFGKFSLGSMAGLIALAISLNIVVLAMKQVSDALGEDGGARIWHAFGVITALLALLVGATILLSSFGGFAAVGGVGAIMAAAALLIVVQALKQISDELGQTDQHVWQSLGVIAASLGILALGLTLMVGAIPGAIALTIASAALIILSGALKLLGGLKLAEIGKALLAMGGALLILAVGLTAMIAALPGAIALTVAAAGLMLLAGVLKVLGSMKLGEIVKSLLTLVVALVAIAAISTVLSVAAPFIIAFAAAIALLGVGLLAVGVGITIFASGMQSLIAILPILGTALSVLAANLTNFGLQLVGGMMDILGLLCEKIVEYAPVIGEAVLAILTLILDVIVQAAPQIADAIYTLLEEIMGVIAEHIPEIAAKGTDMMLAFMEAISNEIPRIVDGAYECAIALINGLADAITENNGDLIDAVDNLMDAVIQAITQWLVKFTPLGLLIPNNMKEGIESGEINVKNAVGEMITGAITAIKDKVSDFREAAENLIAGFIEGLKGSWAGQAAQEAANFAADVVKSMNSKKGLDERSPSRKSRQSAIYFVQGFINGLKETSDEAINASAVLGSNISLALKSAIENANDIAESSMEIHPVIAPTLDLSDLRNGASIANSLFAGRSIALASQVSLEHAQNAKVSTSDNGSTTVSGTGTTFIQNNYSPKALSRIDIYRDTRNLFSQAKGALS